MTGTKYKKMGDIINKLPCSKGRTKLKFHQDFSKFFDQIIYPRETGKFNLKKILSVKILKA